MYKPLHPVGGDNFRGSFLLALPCTIGPPIVDTVICCPHTDAVGVVLRTIPLALFHFFFTGVGLSMAKDIMIVTLRVVA